MRASATSVITLVKGRRTHLENLMEGLQRQSTRPNELVIVYMQPDAFTDLPKLPFPVREVFVEAEGLPLAQARNAGARAASGDKLVFLDVDCIPDVEAIASYSRALRLTDGVFMGEVRYLPPLRLESPLEYDVLRSMGNRHVCKPEISSGFPVLEPNYQELWSLSFGIRKGAYERCGGFDEAFLGYGGEDTDFGTNLGRQSIPLYWLPNALAFHQHHESADPPLQHFNSICRNANYFYEKWGFWCMDYWLDQFAELGLIQRHHDRVEILRRPR